LEGFPTSGAPKNRPTIKEGNTIEPGYLTGKAISGIFVYNCKHGSSFKLSNGGGENCFYVDVDRSSIASCSSKNCHRTGVFTVIF
jgi:hypothetical protein